MKKINYPEKPIMLTDDNFDESIKKYPIIIVDFWANWCAPCIIMAPVIEELAKKYKGKVVFGKLNVDKSRLTATKYAVMSIPTLLVFKNGKLINRITGALPIEALEKRIKKYLEE